MPAASLIALGSALALAAVALTSCGGGGGLTSPESAPPVSPSPPVAAVNMSGRWMLSSPGRGQCYMNFGAIPSGSGEGTIAPEGGCPGKFFTSRKWVFQPDGLVMRDHTGRPLAQLSDVGGRFEGKASSGEVVTLTR